MTACFDTNYAPYEGFPRWEDSDSVSLNEFSSINSKVQGLLQQGDTLVKEDPSHGCFEFPDFESEYIPGAPAIWWDEDRSHSDDESIRDEPALSVHEDQISGAYGCKTALVSQSPITNTNQSLAVTHTDIGENKQEPVKANRVRSKSNPKYNLRLVSAEVPVKGSRHIHVWVGRSKWIECNECNRQGSDYHYRLWPEEGPPDRESIFVMILRAQLLYVFEWNSKIEVWFGTSGSSSITIQIEEHRMAILRSYCGAVIQGRKRAMR